MGKVELKFDTKLAFDGNRTRTPSLPLGSLSKLEIDLTFRPRKLTVSLPVSSYLCVKPHSLAYYAYINESSARMRSLRCHRSQG